MGNAAAKALNWLEAVEHYTVAIDINPLEKTLLSNRALASLSMGEAVNSVFDAIACVDVDPTWHKAYFRCALFALCVYVLVCVYVYVCVRVCVCRLAVGGALCCRDHLIHCLNNNSSTRM